MAEAKKTTRKSKAAKTAEQAPEATTDESVTPTVEVEPVKLTLQDLSAIRTLIDVATQRGAYQAAEMSQVGAIFDRLNTFLTQVEAAQKEAAPAEGDAATPAE